MKRVLVVLLVLVAPKLMAQTRALPQEVRAFIGERRVCEHFLGEPVEGNTPERAERQRFVNDSIDIYCAGTDKRLAALKRRFQNNRSVMSSLKVFEKKVEE